LSVVSCRHGDVNLAAWAERNGVARVMAYRWFHGGLLPVPARKAVRLILADEPGEGAPDPGVTAGYARVSSADQKADLDRQVARVTAWATGQQMPAGRVVTELLISMCARLCGRRAAANRAGRALAAAAAEGAEAA
jgi:predicted site-specific integrase-resolvase